MRGEEVKGSSEFFREFIRFGGAKKKTIQETSSQSVFERAVFEPNLLNQSSKQRTGCAISYLLESKLAQYLIQNYHQPLEMLIVSPHNTADTAHTAVTVYNSYAAHTACTAYTAYIAKSHLRQFRQICTTENTEKENRRWMCSTFFQMDWKKKTL